MVLWRWWSIDEVEESGYIDGDLAIKFQSAVVRIANISVKSDLLESKPNASLPLTQSTILISMAQLPPTLSSSSQPQFIVK